jgi:hypothetical protein
MLIFSSAVTYIPWQNVSCCHPYSQRFDPRVITAGPILCTETLRLNTLPLKF